MHLLRELAFHGSGFIASCKLDILSAELAGVDPDKIILTTQHGLDEIAINYAINKGIVVNVYSLRDLDVIQALSWHHFGKKARVLLQIKPDVDSVINDNSDIDSFIHKIKESFDDLELVGLHCEMDSNNDLD